MNDFHFDEFDAVSAKEWKQKIQVDLKGADYNDTLVWQSLEGIHVKPCYHSDDFTKPFTPIPGQPSHWDCTQAIFIDDIEIANKLAVDAIERGATALYFTIDNDRFLLNPEALYPVFSGVPFEAVTLYLRFEVFTSEIVSNIISFLSEKSATAFYLIDPIGKLARSGNWQKNQITDFKTWNQLITAHPSEAIGSVDLRLYQNAGANCVQQLGYALAHANEYFNSVQDLKQPLTFEVAVGTNYFFEIAKLRALRKLYAALAAEYKFPTNCNIIAGPSKRNKTLYDYNINMLRTTTECMSAILGGANAICNLPYDGIYHKSNEFGERIARNQLLILKSESYFDLVSNAADGSYYIESLTEELAQKALVLFKDIEKNGGFLQQLKHGKIQKKIKESAQKEQHLFNDGSLVLVGTNKYQNDVDQMKEALELYPFLKRNPRQTAIAPILEMRLAEALEQERLSHE